VNWIDAPGLEGERRVTSRIRHAAADVPAVIAPLGAGRVHVRFEDWPRAAAPGQAVAFYDGDVVLGGGIICDVHLAGGGDHAQHPKHLEHAEHR
jgi:tRNA-specific 2-thiouridylase